jgi:small subunit ribosomal protein S1
MDPIQTESNVEDPEERVDEVAAEVAPVPAAPRAGSPEMAELPMQDWDYQQPKRGQIRPGVILSIGEQEIIVGLDAKRDGVVPYADIQRLGAEAVSRLSVGDRVDVFVLQTEELEGNLVVSIYQARQAKDWQHATELAERGEILEVPVVGYNKGGAVVPVGDLRGFVPASQLPGFPLGLSQEERLQRLAELVGVTLRVKVIEVDRRSRRLVLSAVAAEREWRQMQRERLMETLREGQVCRGRVSSLAAFGAFVDLGGAEGLVHLSELSWQRVRHPREVLRVGDEVEVYIMSLDEENKRIGLSLKRLQPEPWARVEDKYELGQRVEGEVTNVVDFGAFAKIEEAVEGLIHVSELTDEPLVHPRDIVRRGDLLLLRIIHIDLRRKRLGLSLKRVLDAEWVEWAGQPPAAAPQAGGRGRGRPRLRAAAKPHPRPHEEAAERAPAPADRPAPQDEAVTEAEPAPEVLQEPEFVEQVEPEPEFVEQVPSEPEFVEHVPSEPEFVEQVEPESEPTGPDLAPEDGPVQP